CCYDHTIHTFPTRRSSDLENGQIHLASIRAHRHGLGLIAGDGDVGQPSACDGVEYHDRVGSCARNEGALSNTVMVFDPVTRAWRSEEHTSELQSRVELVCR